RVLARGDDEVHLTPKELDTLVALVRGAGRVMSKEELLKEIWPDTFVGEATLAQNVFTLRKALGEAEGGRAYIETVPRRGYKFAAKVRERREEVSLPASEGAFESSPVGATQIEGRKLDASAARVGVESAGQNVESANGASSHAAIETDATAATPSSTTDGATPPRVAAAPSRVAAQQADAGHPVRGAIVISFVAVAFVAALVYGVFRFVVRPQTASTPRASAFQSMKVTRIPVSGAVIEASISPDGKYLAYVASEPGSQNVSVWVRQVAAASNIQRIVPPAEATFYAGLVFSPDSQHLYFASGRTDNNSPGMLSRVPAFGGPVEKVLERINSPASFAPDGKRLVVQRADGDNRLLIVANTDGAGERTLVTRRGPTIFGLPTWSPDGRRIACVYGSLENLQSSTPYLGVTTFDADSGAETKVTDERWVGISQLAWLPDSSGLVLSAAEQELSPSQIWQLSFPSGEARRVTNDLNTYIGASLTSDASALVTVQTDRVPNIWVAPSGDAARARQITSGAGKFDGFYGVAWMPDGRIVYSSIASGSWDIWMMNADGSGQKQLTVGGRSSYGPSASADGRYIVFVSNRAGGTFNVWRMDADGSNPKQLTFGKGENFAHTTPDGRWVVYATVGFGQMNVIWKVPIDGGEPVQLTSRPSSWPFVAPDGKSFVCTYGGGSDTPPKLALVPIDGGEPTKLFDIQPSFRANTVWLPDNRGIAFLDSRDGTTNVWMQPLAGGKHVKLTDFQNDGVAAYDWSRDGRLAATRSVETTSVVLIRDFR
ncbi:MAG TPA: winged helix-turn-helix domain-containing protein, partial [Pyrinomonadaceae bacterium]|nr:winged helix-turn-helix domain-containing protein [Pyrinomonadaceae bacterium]